MTRMTLIISLSAMLLTACVNYEVVVADPEENYLSFNHPFTDQAIADVKARAHQLCKELKKETIQTAKSCSLTKCTTSYQCVSKEDIIKFGL